MTFINNCTTPSELIPQIAALPALQGLDPAVLQSLAQGAQRQQHRDGETLFCEGDIAHHWLLIESGCIEVVRYGHEGQELVFHCFQAGQSVAEAAMFMAHGRYPMTARTKGTTGVWRLSREAMRHACERHPDLAMRLLEDFSKRLYRYVNEVQWLTTSSAPERLAAYLLRLPRTQQGAVTLPLSQRQLAANLGIRAETLSRLFAEWQAQNWLSGQRRSWTLLHILPLRDLAFGSTRPF
jgi:CRP-like cAMP-binding protein